MPAAADTGTPVPFTLGRVVHSTPDARGRIGIRSICQNQSGCNLELRIQRAGTNPPVVFGRVFVLLIGGSTETDYVILSKHSLKLLATKRTLKATVLAVVKDSAGNTSTYTKDFTLRAPAKKR